MPFLDFAALAGQLPTPWKSSPVGHVGPAQIKVLRMDEQAYAEETHDYDEALLVITGQLILSVDEETIEVRSGQMFLVEAGTPHRVLAGSNGTLLIIDPAT